MTAWLSLSFMAITQLPDWMVRESSALLLSQQLSGMFSHPFARFSKAILRYFPTLCGTNHTSDFKFKSDESQLIKAMGTIAKNNVKKIQKLHFFLFPKVFFP